MEAANRKVMEARFFDIRDREAPAGHSTKEVLFGGENYHVWVHIDEPGKQGPMHRHSADQCFYCVQGECTFHFPNGESAKLAAGMAVVIPKGQLYQLHNTGLEHMILLGSRAEAHGKARHTGKGAVIHNEKGQYVVESGA